jgi:hypothetical protein
VIGFHDLAAFERGGMDIPKEEWLAVAPLHTELLVEIAIIDFAAPANAEGIVAHEAGNSRGIKYLDQQLHDEAHNITHAQSWLNSNKGTKSSQDGIQTAGAMLARLAGSEFRAERFGALFQYPCGGAGSSSGCTN